jgi:hypothetical protein
MTVELRGLLYASVTLSTLCAATPTHAAVTISTAATSNMSCVSGVCTPTAKKAVLNVGDLTTMLGSGNVVVNTGSGTLAQQVKDIVVSASFNWANASSLTLDAYGSVSVNQPVAVNGSGAVVLTTDDGGTKGALLFGKKGSLSFLGTSNSLTINATPYVLVNSIATLASAVAANPSGAYALADNFEASKDGAYNNSPVPTTLLGTFEGLGNTISHLSIDAEIGYPYVALFTEIGTSGVVDGLRLVHERVVIRNAKASAAGLAGENYGTVSRDEVEGAFVGKKTRCYLAGLVVVNDSVIIASSANVRISSCSFDGGLAGGNGGFIETSSASGSINGAEDAGGLSGGNQGEISDSFASVDVSASVIAAGLVAVVDSGSVRNSYATGNVSGGPTAIVGGFAGYSAAYSEIKSSYAIGAVSGGASDQVGGFMGLGGEMTFFNCYWDTTTSGTNDGFGGGNGAGLTGLTTEQLQAGPPSGFNPAIWAETRKINNGFPYLINNPPQ